MPRRGQCGGTGYTGCRQCADGRICSAVNGRSLKTRDKHWTDLVQRVILNAGVIVLIGQSLRSWPLSMSRLSRVPVLQIGCAGGIGGGWGL